MLYMCKKSVKRGGRDQPFRLFHTQNLYILYLQVGIGLYHIAHTGLLVPAYSNPGTFVLGSCKHLKTTASSRALRLSPAVRKLTLDLLADVLHQVV